MGALFLFNAMFRSEKAEGMEEKIIDFKSGDFKKKSRWIIVGVIVFFVLMTLAKQLKANPDIIKYNYVEKLSDNIQVIVTDQSTIMDLKGMLERKK